MSDITETIERLEKLAAWHRINADHAVCDWTWELRVRTAEDLEHRAANLCTRRHDRSAPHPRDSRRGGDNASSLISGPPQARG
jgi:hypothetical protein